MTREKFEEMFEELLGIYKTNQAEARELALKIPVEKLDYEVLIRFQESDNEDVRNLARELLLKHFGEKISRSKEAEAFEAKWLNS